MHSLTRRDLLKGAAVSAGAALLPTSKLLGRETARALPHFHTDAAGLQRRHDAAVAGLARNVRHVFGFPEPVLIEGGRYPGIWLECGPQEGLVYADYNPEAAINNHRVFFAERRPGGWLPCAIKGRFAEFSQIQSVVPIAATALEVARQTGNEALLEEAYQACGEWNAWMLRYRNTRGTGLCEAFCGYDTGMDRNARFAGLPWACPQRDARICPPNPTLPYLAPDLSANVYGERMALARMARLLGRPAAEADRWLEQAHVIQQALMKWCFDPEDAFFYDFNARNQFVRIRTVVITRVLGGHMVDHKLFGEIYARHVHNPKEFWAPWPIPSVALDDPQYDPHPPVNSWCGPSQALTALRAPRWMEHYGKPADLAHLMQQWVEALVRAPQFQQQLDPMTGVSSTGEEYSPAMLVLVDFTRRLYGVRQNWEAGGDELEWNIRLPAGATEASFELPTKRGTAELRTRRVKERHTGRAGLRGEMWLGGKRIAWLETSGAVRLVTSDAGAGLLRLVGTGAEAVTVSLRGGRSHTVDPNGAVTLRD